MTFPGTPMRAPALKPAVLLLALSALGLAACKKAGAEAEVPRGLKVEAYDAPIPKAPLTGGKLETTAPHPEAVSSIAPPVTPQPASGAPVAVLGPPLAPAQPQPQATAAPAAGQRLPTVLRVADPPPAAPQPQQAPAVSPDAPLPEDAPGFHISVQTCRRAERQGDPLAQTPECRSRLDAAREQSRLCAKAFEDGDDKVVLSDACRQAARLR